MRAARRNEQYDFQELHPGDAFEPVTVRMPVAREVVRHYESVTIQSAVQPRAVATPFASSTFERERRASYVPLESGSVSIVTSAPHGVGRPHGASRAVAAPPFEPPFARRSVEPRLSMAPHREQRPLPFAWIVMLLAMLVVAALVPRIKRGIDRAVVEIELPH